MGGVLGNIKIVVIDRDDDYLKPLANYLVTHLSHQFIVKAYSELEAIKNQLMSLETENNVLVIIDEKIYERVHPSLLIEPLILSSGHKNGRIHKYISGKEMIHIIKEKLKDIEDYIPFTKKQETVLGLGFYSPIGGVGVSSLALIASILLSQKNVPTLFISLDHTSGLDFLLEKESNNSLSKYFYYYLSEPNLLVEKLKSNIKTYKGLSYISSFESIIDYEEVSEEDLVGFFKLIKKELNYQRIIIDLPSFLNQKNIGIMKQLDGLILVSQGRLSDHYKLKHLKEDLRTYDLKDLICQDNSILLINQVKESNVLYKKGGNPFEIEEREIPFSDTLVNEEDLVYKVPSQFKYVLETVLEDIKGDGSGK